MFTIKLKKMLSRISFALIHSLSFVRIFSFIFSTAILCVNIYPIISVTNTRDSICFRQFFFCRIFVILLALECFVVFKRKQKPIYWRSNQWMCVIIYNIEPVINLRNFQQMLFASAILFFHLGKGTFLSFQASQPRFHIVSWRMRLKRLKCGQVDNYFKPQTIKRSNAPSGTKCSYMLLTLNARFNILSLLLQQNKKKCVSISVKKRRKQLGIHFLKALF